MVTICVSSRHDSDWAWEAVNTVLHMGRVRGHLVMSKYHREVKMEPGQSISQSMGWSEKNYWPLLDTRYLVLKEFNHWYSYLITCCHHMPECCNPVWYQGTLYPRHPVVRVISLVELAALSQMLQLPRTHQGWIFLNENKDTKISTLKILNVYLFVSTL